MGTANGRGTKSRRVTADRHPDWWRRLRTEWCHLHRRRPADRHPWVAACRQGRGSADGLAGQPPQPLQQHHPDHLPARCCRIGAAGPLQHRQAGGSRAGRCLLRDGWVSGGLRWPRGVRCAGGQQGVSISLAGGVFRPSAQDDDSAISAYLVPLCRHAAGEEAPCPAALLFLAQPWRVRFRSAGRVVYPSEFQMNTLSMSLDPSPRGLGRSRRLPAGIRRDVHHVNWLIYGVIYTRQELFFKGRLQRPRWGEFGTGRRSPRHGQRGRPRLASVGPPAAQIGPERAQSGTCKPR